MFPLQTKTDVVPIKNTNRKRKKTSVQLCMKPPSVKNGEKGNSIS